MAFQQKYSVDNTGVKKAGIIRCEEKEFTCQKNQS